MNTVKLLTTIWLSLLGVSGCLPADTRPEPGRVYASAALATDLQGDTVEFVTDDGWTVTLSKLTASLGNLSLDGDNCNAYAEARYRRVIDFLQPGEAKLAQAFGLNGCLVGYGVAVPNEEAVLGPGVTDKDGALMANASVPVSAATGVTTTQGMALHVQGILKKQDVQVDFDWGFSDRVNFVNCRRALAGKTAETFEDPLPLVGGETTRVTMRLEPRNLFVARVAAGANSALSPTGVLSVDDGATSLVQLIADADQLNGNGNGHVDLDELFATSVPGTVDNLAEVLRKLSYPSVFLYDQGGQCEIEAKRSGRGPMH